MVCEAPFIKSLSRDALENRAHISVFSVYVTLNCDAFSNQFELDWTVEDLFALEADIIITAYTDICKEQQICKRWPML